MSEARLNQDEDSRTEKLTRRLRNLTEDKRCTLCPLHDGENKPRRARHGAKKPKRKNKRRGGAA